MRESFLTTLSIKIEEFVKRKVENKENTDSVCEWNRLPVDRMQHMQPANTKMRTEVKTKSGN